MTDLKNVLLHSILRKENLCCLCFNTLGSDPIDIEDEAMVEDVSSRIQLSEVLVYIFGDDVVENLAFQSICSDCVMSAVHSYTFIKRCRESYDVLHHAIDNLNNCFQSSIEEKDSCKSLFVSLDSGLSTQMYYDYRKPVTSLPGALARFKYISTDKYNGKYYIQNSPEHQPKTCIESEFSDNYDDECDFNMPVKSEKLKTKHKMEFLSDNVMFHKNSKTKNKKYICNGCHKNFESATILRMHYMRVHAPKNLECPKCDRRFSARMLLDMHLSISHTDAVCFECGKTFTNVASLKKHEFSHKSTKYICKTCHRVYKTLRTIKDHVNNGVCARGYTSRKSGTTGQFICEICKNRFGSKNALRSHMVTLHGFGSDETVHTCTWCNKRFQAVSSLRSHIVTHTGERKFYCDLCDEKFVTHAALVNHTRLHTGERPYACDFCDECFVSASRRMEHLRRKHLEPSQQCRLCPAIFKSGAGKRKHERRHFNPSSKFYVPKSERPAGIKEPKEIPIETVRKRRVVVRINTENL